MRELVSGVNDSTNKAFSRVTPTADERCHNCIVLLNQLPDASPKGRLIAVAEAFAKPLTMFFGGDRDNILHARLVVFGG